MRKRTLPLPLLLVVVALLAGACGSDDGSGDAASTDTTDPTVPADSSTTDPADGGQTEAEQAKPGESEHHGGRHHAT